MQQNLSASCTPRPHIMEERGGLRQIVTVATPNLLMGGEYEFQSTFSTTLWLFNIAMV